MQEMTVKYKNDLNAIPMRKFNAKEMDLFFAICSKMKNQDTNTVRFGFEDLRELSNYKMTATNHFVKDLDNVYSKMLNLTYKIENENELTRFVLFNRFTLNKTDKYVEISVNSDFSFILNQLTSEFTQFELKEFTDLRSSYSKTMYRLLKQFKSTGYYTVKIDEFRELLDVPESYKMRDISVRVLNVVLKDLSKIFTDLRIEKHSKKSEKFIERSYRQSENQAKKGEQIVRLVFKFNPRNLISEEHNEGELPKIPMYNWLSDKN